VDAIAYPYGHYDERVLALAERAGYRSGWAAGLTRSGGALARERLQISRRDGDATFRVKASGYAGWARRTVHQALALVGKGELCRPPRG
jgi:hypothetical protein